MSIIRIIGQIEAEQGNWGEVKDWMSKALKIDPNDVLAEYYLAIGYRETGKYKAWLLRNRDWNRAQNYFQSVIDKAPTFKDIFYQNSILARYMDQYQEAVRLAEKQMEITPDNIQVEKSLNQYYDLLLFYENDKVVRDWLLERINHRTQYYMGELKRRNNEFSEADSIFLALLNLPDLVISKTLLRQSLAKLRFQQDKPEEAEKFYTMSIDSIRDQVDAELVFEDLKYILSDEEYEEYMFCESVSDEKKLFKKIWLTRNPIPASNINYRIREHIRRILYADKYYRFDGFRTTVNNPDKLHYLEFPQVFELNNKYNDKGLIYIRHGQPDDIATELHGKGGPLPASDSVEGVLQNESWLYYSSGNNPKLIFHFVIDRHATGNNWRLIPTITPDMVDSRLNWDPIFNRMKMVETEVEFFGLQREMAIQSRENVYRGLSTDRHSWQKNIESIQFPFYVCTFRDKDELSRFELYYTLNFSDIWSNSDDPDEIEPVTVNCGIYDEAWNEVAHGEKIVPAKKIKSASDSLGYWLDQFKFSVKPGKYKVSIAAYVIPKNKIGGYKFNSGVSSYLGNRLTMSSIVLATDIKTANHVDAFYKNGLSVIPNPFLRFNKKNLLHIYYEIYNLPFSPGRNTEFNVEYNFTLLEKKKKNIFSRIGGLFTQNKPWTANTVERYAKGEFSAEYLALDLSRNESGLYELEVVTEVPSNNEKFSRKIEFELQ
ncbi:GWxTD domain-containing protein [candidate division KSB1 bacterium]|nr:GWxTD domain-containing protein [candidate division KSB1 bacterium]